MCALDSPSRALAEKGPSGGKRVRSSCSPLLLYRGGFGKDSRPAPTLDSMAVNGQSVKSVPAIL